MNLPNKLTMLRIFLIPFFLVFLLIETIPFHSAIALVIFIVASFTDMLDGQIARKYNLITDFGKFMDPLADKLLTMSAMVALIQVIELPAVIIIIILGREFAVTALRTLAADKGIVIAADKWGKIKTITQMLWIIYTLLLLSVGTTTAILWTIATIGMYLALFFTILSGANYLIKNKAVYMSSK